MNSLLQYLENANIDTVLSSCSDFFLNYPNFSRQVLVVDGGAGTGSFSVKVMQRVVNARVIAFEPFPGNFTSFPESDRITLEKLALSNKDAIVDFVVPSMCTRTGQAFIPIGSSTTGFIGKPSNDSLDTIRVSAVTLSSYMDDNSIDSIDFLKLDLQGGEFDCLSGMGDKLSRTTFAWIEYAGDTRVLDYLQSFGFQLFDTDYLFVGEPNQYIESIFKVKSASVGINSIGKKIFFGRRRSNWLDYNKQFDFCRRKRRMVQTDILAVSAGAVEEFVRLIASW